MFKTNNRKVAANQNQEANLQCLLTFSYSISKRKFFTLLLFFSSFYFLNALQSDKNSNRVYALGHK